MKKYSRIFQYLSQYKGKIVLYFVYTVLSTVFSIVSLGMLAPFLTIIFKTGDAKEELFKSSSVSSYIKEMIDGQMRTGGPLQALVFICALILIATILKNLFLYLSYVISSPMRSAITRQMRADMYDKLLTLPIGFFTDQRKGDIMSKMSNDVAEIEGSIVSTMEGLIKDPLTILAYLGFLVYISPTLSLFLLILLPVTGFLIGRISRSLKKQSMEAAIKNGEAISVLDETLSGIRIIKAFTAENILRNKFLNINEILYQLRVKMARRRDLASPMTEVLGVAVLCTILYFGGRLVLVDHNESLQPGDLITYIAVFAIIINPAKNLSTAFFNLQKGSAAMQRVEELLITVSQVQEKENGKELSGFNKSIEFKNVSFNYGDAQILKNINLKIEKGRTIALVGSSGAGKSTLADLVPRFHDVSEGELLIDGINIKEYSLHSLRSMIGIVTQEPILFNDTISENIMLGKPGSMSGQVMLAAKVANAHLFIADKEKGYETNIGDRGNKLSGGERQRVTIARAVLKDPPILILDEATSALDTESERLVQDAINNLTHDRTSLVIAHRLSTIRHADEIIVMQKGEIVERGNHDDLVAQNGFYKKLVDMQEFK